MNPNPAHPAHRVRRPNAFTKTEVLIVLFVIAVIALAVVPELLRSRARSSRIKCINNVKNLGLALRVHATDDNGAWPWQVSTNHGGSMEFLGDPVLAWTHFVALSNELSTPRILRCPNDPTGIEVARWADARTNAALSYFLGLEATEERPDSILGGDSNLELDGIPLRTQLLSLRTNAHVGFDNRRAVRRHDPRNGSGVGNILLGDGSVQQVTSARFREALRDSPTPTNGVLRWLIP